MTLHIYFYIAVKALLYASGVTLFAAANNEMDRSAFQKDLNKRNVVGS